MVLKTKLRLRKNTKYSQNDLKIVWYAVFAQGHFILTYLTALCKVNFSSSLSNIWCASPSLPYKQCLLFRRVSISTSSSSNNCEILSMLYHAIVWQLPLLAHPGPARDAIHCALLSLFIASSLLPAPSSTGFSHHQKDLTFVAFISSFWSGCLWC